MKKPTLSLSSVISASRRCTFAFVLLALSAGKLASQDRITLRNGNDLNGKISEITESEIKYTPAENPGGPLRVLDKKDVFLIRYENGTKEVISPVTGAEVSESSPTTGKSGMKIDTSSYVPIPSKKFGGPRIGVTYLTPGTSADWLTDQGKQPLVTQFGWQFETRMFSVENGPSGIVEFVPLIGGMEQGLFLPSASLLVGLRGAGNQSIEAAVGPNLSLTGIGMVFAVGCNFRSGHVNFPVNIAYVPSVGRKEDNRIIQTGSRLTITVGFNMRKK